MSALTLIGVHRAVSSLLETRPHSWRVVRFKGLFDRLDQRNTDLSYEMLSLRSTGEVVARAETGGRQEPDETSLPRYLIAEVNDLVVNPMWLIGGGIGVSGRAGAVSPDYRVFRCHDFLLHRFIHYLLRSQPYLDQYLLYTRAQTTFDRRVQQPDLDNLPIPLPPLDEQRAIVGYLDRETARIDTLIEEQQHLIKMLRERRAADLSSALAPTGSWVRRRVKHIGETNLGKMLDAGRVVREGDEPRPYVRAADVRADGSVNLVDLNEMPFSEVEMEVFDLRAGDVLLIEGGATVGRPGFMFESAPGIAFQKTVNRLRVGPDVDARFVYWSMLRLYDSAYYVNHYGSVSFVHLTGEKLREIELHLPALAEQRRIAAYLNEQTAKIDTLIAETERFVELSRERRAALITAAVTGQIDVRELV